MCMHTSAHVYYGIVRTRPTELRSCMYTPSLEDESHTLKQEAKLQSRKAFRTATPATKPPMAHVVQNDCTVLSSLPIFSAQCFLQYPRHESGKPPSVRGHTHTERSAATCCEIAGSEGKSLLASPPPESKSSGDSCQAATKPSLKFQAFDTTFSSHSANGKRHRV